MVLCMDDGVFICWRQVMARSSFLCRETSSPISWMMDSKIGKMKSADYDQRVIAETREELMEIW